MTSSRSRVKSECVAVIGTFKNLCQEKNDLVLRAAGHLFFISFCFFSIENPTFRNK